MQERRNSIANALELRLSCTNPSICWYEFCFSIKYFLTNSPSYARWVARLVGLAVGLCREWESRSGGEGGVCRPNTHTLNVTPIHHAVAPVNSADVINTDVNTRHWRQKARVWQLKQIALDQKVYLSISMDSSGRQGSVLAVYLEHQNVVSMYFLMSFEQGTCISYKEAVMPPPLPPPPPLNTWRNDNISIASKRRPLT